jgi:hypothetical protein
MNSSMRPILCVIDLTEKSAQVLEVAARMACAYKSHLTILFPYRLLDKGENVDVAKLKTKLEQDAKEKFLVMKSQVLLLSQVSHEFQAEIGFPADRIHAFVRRNKVNCVVISQRQASLMNEVNQLAFQNLISNTRLPFTVVPEEVDVELVS